MVVIVALVWTAWLKRRVVTALKPVRAEQVRRPEWKQNWTVPLCGSVLPICLSLRPVGSIHISCLAAREQTSVAQIAKAPAPYDMKYFCSFFGIIFQFHFWFFLTEAASTSARTVVPLTTPLLKTRVRVMRFVMTTSCANGQQLNRHC